MNIRNLLFLLFLMASLMLGSCSKEKPSLDQTVMSNVTIRYEGEKSGTSAYPSIVLFFPEEAVGFDKEKSISSIAYDRELIMPDLKVIKPVIRSDNLLGVNTFENVPNGKYVLVAFHKPEDFTFPGYFYYGYRYIEVGPNKLNNYHFDFIWQTHSGKFIEFK